MDPYQAFWNSRITNFVVYSGICLAISFLIVPLWKLAESRNVLRIMLSKAFWNSRITNLLVYSGICLAISFLIIPLHKLSKSRKALSLMLSKAIGVFLFNAFLINDLLGWHFGYRPYWFRYLTWLNAVPYLSIRLHLAVMAFNRVHAVYFPFNYKFMLKKSFNQKLCFVVWVFAACLCPLNIYADLNNKTVTFPMTIFLRYNLEQFCLYTAIFLYSLMSAKLLWMKYKMGTTAVEQMECEKIKICIACLAGVIPFILSLVAMFMLVKMDADKNDNWLLKDLLTTLNVPGYQISQLSEEICLLLICKDFRRLARSHFRAILAKILFIVSVGKIDRTNGTGYSNSQQTTVFVSQVEELRKALKK